MRLRQIPPGNVVYLKDVPTHETISVDEFRNKILKPVLLTMARSGLNQQIDYIVYSSDLPYAVSLRSDIVKLENKPAKIFTPVGSINGLTYLAGIVMSGNPAYISLNTNFYTRRMVRANGNQPKAANPQPVKPEEQAAYKEAQELIQNKKWSEAAKLYEKLLTTRAENPLLHYNLACCYARIEKADEAMQSLKAALKTGWTNHEHALRDDDLKTLRNRKDFQAWIAELKKIQFDVQPALGFRNQYQWDARGERVCNRRCTVPSLHHARHDEWAR